MWDRVAFCRQSLVTFSAASILSLVVVGIAGCGGSREDTRGVRVSGEGVVTLDGEPLQMGRIVFITNQGNGEVKAAAMIQHGSFVFSEDTGPLEGTARVEIHAVELELEDFEKQRGGDPGKLVDITRVDVPKKYSVNSTLSATVSAEDGIDPLIFELTSP